MSLASIRRDLERLQAVVAQRSESRIDAADMSPAEIVRRIAFILHNAKKPTASAANLGAASRVREILGPELSDLFDRAETYHPATFAPSLQTVPAH